MGIRTRFVCSLAILVCIIGLTQVLYTLTQTRRTVREILPDHNNAESEVVKPASITPRLRSAHKSCSAERETVQAATIAALEAEVQSLRERLNQIEAHATPCPTKPEISMYLLLVSAARILMSDFACSLRTPQRASGGSRTAYHEEHALTTQLPKQLEDEHEIKNQRKQTPNSQSTPLKTASGGHLSVDSTTFLHAWQRGRIDWHDQVHPARYERKTFWSVHFC